MSFLEYRVKFVPSGLRKVLYMNWPLVVLVTAVSAVGFLTLYSIAGGRMEVWAGRQMKVFGLGAAIMFFIAFVPIWFWRNMSLLAYLVSIILLLIVEFFGTIGMGAQRWIEFGGFRLQPSELMKVTLVMMLAAYYDWLDVRKVSNPLWVAVPVILTLIPTVLVLMQPNLGTALIILMIGGAVMLLAGVSWWYFAAVLLIVVGAVTSVFTTRGTDWQFLHD